MEHMWSRRFGDGSYDDARAVAVDASGNIIIAGSSYGIVDFGGGALIGAGNRDIFVAKLGSDGAHLWSKRFGDADTQYARAVAVDASGNVVVAGCLQSTVDFGGGALSSAGGEDIFVAKFGSDGAHLWSKRFGDSDGQFVMEDQVVEAVAIDAPGDVIVTGCFDTLTFGGDTLKGAGRRDIYIAKFGSDGAHLWSKRFGASSDENAQSVAVDASGNVIITGCFWDSLTFGGDTLKSAGERDIYIAKFGSDGVHLWSKRFGDRDSQYAKAVAVDASGNVIVTGWFYGAVDFGGGVLMSAGNKDIFVAEFGSDGAHRWSRRFGDGDSQYAQAIAVDASGNVIITGFFWGTVDFGGCALTSAGGCDLFVAKFGADGLHISSKRFGDGSAQVAEAVAVDALGNAIVAGWFYGAIDFGGGVLTSAGNNDIFVAKFGR
jgi:hypothetical protein